MVDDSTILALQRQVECYRRLVKLAQLQHEHVQQSQTERLLEVLGKRQEMLDQIRQIEASIGAVKGQWARYLAGLEDGPRAQAEALLAETKRLLEEIVAADRNDVLVLQQRKLNLGKAIGQTTAARQVNRNYATAAYGRAASKVVVSG